MKRAMVIGSILVGAAVLFTSGFAYSVSLHGDWTLIRHDGACAAYDTQATIYRGTWSPGDDGLCHMSTFIWQRLFRGG